MERRGIRIGDRSGDFGTIIVRRVGPHAPANLRLGVLRRLSLGRGTSIDYFILFSFCGSFGVCREIGKACSFDTFGSGHPGSFFSLTQTLPRAGLRDIRFVACSRDSLVRFGF